MELAQRDNDRSVSRLGWRRLISATTALQAVTTAILLTTPLPAAALPPNAQPTGGSVSAGNASISQNATTTTINQASNRAAINWQSYDVGSAQSVQYQQPSSSSVTLNRVQGPNPSEIAGKIRANGQLVIVNQAGVVFDNGAQVNAAGIVVSAAGITDSNFMAGKMVFDQAANPGVLVANNGQITVQQSGLAALVAPQVRNAGVINARMGTVILGGAEAATLDLYGDGLVSINVTKQVQTGPGGKTALVTNTGTIAASGGSVVLTASAVDGVVQNLVDAGGNISANSLPGRNGQILISGVGGDVVVEGVVSAKGSGTGLTGGIVQVAGTNVTVMKSTAQINASGLGGGGTVSLGTATGTAPITSAKLVVKSGAKINADATLAGSGGTVTLSSNAKTVIGGTVSARGIGAMSNTGSIAVQTVSSPGAIVVAQGAQMTTATVSLQGGGANIAGSVTGTTSVSFDQTGAMSETAPGATSPTGIITTPMLEGSATGTVDLSGVNKVQGVGPFTAGSGFTLNNSTSTLTVLGQVDGGTTVALTNTGQLRITAPITATGAVTLDANGISQSSAGTITAGTLIGNAGTGAADFSEATNLVTNLGSFSATTGFTLNDGVTLLTVGGAVNGGTGVAITNTGSLAINAPMSAAGTVDLAAFGITQASSGTITGGTLIGNAGTGSADFGEASNLVTELGPFTAGNGFSLNDGVTLLTLGGAVDGGTGVAITNSGSLAINAPVNATGTVDLIARGIAQNSSGTITAGALIGNAGTGAADFSEASNVVTDVGPFTAGNGFALNDGVTLLTVGGALNGGTGVAITNTGSLAINAPVIATGTVDLVAIGIAQTSAGTITAGTLIGNAGTGGADLSTATNLVVNLGSFSATTGFTLNDNTTPITVIGAVDGGTGVTITNTGSLAINAPVTATGTVDLIALGIAQTGAGTITAGTLIGNAGTGAADLSEATNLVTDLGPYTAGNGFTLKDGVTLLTIGGALNGGSGVAITNTGNLAINAPVSATGTVDLVAVGIAQTSAGTITAGTLIGNAVTGAADFGEATNLVTDLGPFTAADGFALNDSVTLLTVHGAVDGGTGVAITNSGSLAINAPLSATGTVDLIALGIAQTSAGTVTAGTLIGNAGTAAADFGEATNLVTNLGPFTAGNGFTLNDGVTLLTVGGAMDGGTDVAITNSGAVAINAPLSATGTVDLIAVGITQNSAGTVTAGTFIGNAGTGAADFSEATNLVTSLGPFTAGNGFVLADGVPLLTIAGAVNGGTGIAITNTGSLAINAPITASGAVDLTAIGISQTSAGIITAGTLTGSIGTGAADLGTATNLVVNVGSFSATTGFTLNDSTPTLTVMGAVNGGTGVAVTNSGSLAINAPVSATGTVDLIALGIAQSSAGTITAGALIGNAGTSAADFGEATNLVTDLGPFTAGNGFALNDGVTLLTVGGAVNGGTGVAITNTGSLAINAPVSAAGTVDLVALGIAQSSAGTITAGTLIGNAGTGAADFGEATNVVTDLGPFAAGDGFALNDGVTLLTVGGAVNGGTGVAVTNSGSLAINAPVSATGTVDLIALGIAQDGAGTVTAGTLIGNAGTGAAKFGEATNLVISLGPFTAGNGFTLNDGVILLTVGGALNGGTGIVITNTGSLAINAPVSATGTVDLIARGIAQTSAGTITAGTLIGNAGTGAADLSEATNLVTDLGPYTAGNGFTLNDGVTLLTIGGALNGGSGVTITNTGSLAINAPVSATGTVDLVAVCIAQTSAGTITAGTLIGNAGTGAADFGEATNLVTDLGPYTAGNGFTLNGGVTLLTIGGALNGGSGVTITNTGSLAINAPVSATGTVDLVAVGIAQNSGGTVTAGTLVGNAGTAAADFGEATNLVTNLGPFTAGSGFALNNNTPVLTVVGAIDGSPTVHLANTGSLVLDAAIDPTSTVILDANGISQTNAGIITAGTLTGSAGTGAADLGTATNLVANLGSFSATTGFTLNDSTPTLTVLGTVNGGTGVAITNTGSLAINAPVSATGTVDLIAVGITQTSAGTITAGTLIGNAGTGAADFSEASNLVTDLGPFTAENGFSLNNNTPLLTVVGEIDGGPTVQLANTGGLTFDAAFDPGNTVVLNANGISQTSAGIITAGTLTGSAGTGAADLGTATNLVANLGSFSATTGFTLNDSTPTLTVIGGVNGGTGVAITNTGGLVINAPITATGTVDLIALGIAQNSAGTITAGTLTGNAGTGAADFSEGSNLVTDLGPFTAGGAFLLADAHALTVVANVTAGTDTTITVNGAGNNLTVETGATIQSGGANTVTLTATNGTIANDGSIQGGTLASLMAGNDIDQSGMVEAAVVTDTAGHDIDHAGNSIATAGSIDLAAGNVIYQSASGGLGTISATGGNVTLIANGNIQPYDIAQSTGALIIDPTPSATIDLTAATGIAFAGTIGAAPQANSTAPTGTVMFTAQAGDITETEGGSHTGTVVALHLTGSATAGGGALGQALFDAPAPDGTTNQIVNLDGFTASDTFALTDGHSLAVTANVTAGANAIVTVNGAGNGLTVNGGVTAQSGPGGTAAITASAGDITNNGSIIGGALASLTAGNDIAQNDLVTAAVVTETAGNSLAQNGVTNATAGNAALTAGNNLTQSAIVSAATDTILTATGGTLAQNGTVTAGNNATLFAGANLLQNAFVRAIDGNAGLTAGGDLTQSAIVTAGNNAALTAITGTLTQNGVVTAGNDASLSAGADLLQNGTVKAIDGSVTLAASDDLIQSGIIAARHDAYLTATYGTLTQNGGITADNNATLVAGADLFQNGSVMASSGNATLTAADNFTQVGSVTAGANAMLTAASGTLNQNGAITAGGNTTLVAGSDFFQTGTIRSVNGTASLTAGNNLTQSAIVGAGVDAMLTAANGTLGQSGIITAGGSAALMAGGSLTQSGVVTAGVDTTLTALGPSLVQTGSLTAGVSAIITAINGSVFDGGTVTAPNIQIAGSNGLVSLYGTLAGVKPDPALNPLFKLAQGAFPSNPAIGAWVIGSNIIVAPNVLVTGAGGGLSELVIVLSDPHGLVSFGNFNNQSTELYLNLSTGLAAGQIAVKALQVQYAAPGTSQTINLIGTVDGQSGSTAASASFIQPKEKNNYQVNGCPIGSANCIQITTIVLPVVNPLKDLEVSTPDQPDDILIILPDVGDRDY